MKKKNKFLELIYFNNRYPGNHVYISHIKDGLYKFYMEGCYYISLHKNEDGSIHSIDPDGGPFIGVGDIVKDDYIIKSIYWDDTDKCYYIELEIINKN